MRPWSNIRTRVLLVPVVPAIALAVIVGFDLHRGAGVVAAAVVAVVVAFAIAIAVSHGITRPLRDLAAIVADTRDLRVADGSAPPDDDVLPARYTHSAPPLADLALAIAEGRRHAAEVVVEQRAERRSVTDLVAHLALRNERLLGAALDALAEISRRDHEPSTAAAIARVHRTVARVDRATASALVLIGEGGRVASYPASVTDAVWAAALAIESSDRVDAASLPDATLHADVVGDVTHLLAELIDNSVAASPPPARVTVLGAADAGGGYEITVMDSGPGMSPDDLDVANARVRKLQLLHRVPARHVGLDVVGRLARRHNIVVRLGESAEGGVVVRVLLPPSLLTAPAVPAPEPERAPERAPQRLPDAQPTWVHSAGDEAAQPLAAPSPVEAWHVDAAPAVAGAPAPVATAAPQPAMPVAPVQVASRAEVQPEVVPPAAPAPVAAPEPIAWSIDLTAMEHRDGASPDEMLPHRSQRKWAAAIAASAAVARTARCRGRARCVPAGVPSRGSSKRGKGMGYTRIDVTPLTNVLGAVVHGPDLREALDEETVGELRAAWHEHKVLFLPAQPIDREQHKRFASYFGEVFRHPYLKDVASDPDVVTLYSGGETQSRYLASGWHTDVTFAPQPPMGSIIRAIEVPPYGGDTMWIDLEAAFSGLSPAMQQFLSTLRATHAAPPRRVHPW